MAEPTPRLSRCPDRGVPVGELHGDGCDTEDYNRPITHARWNAGEQRYHRTDTAKPTTP